MPCLPTFLLRPYLTDLHHAFTLHAGHQDISNSIGAHQFSQSPDVAISSECAFASQPCNLLVDMCFAGSATCSMLGGKSISAGQSDSSCCNDPNLRDLG